MKKLTLLIVLALMASCTPKKNTVKAATATISGVEVGSQCPVTTQTNQQSGTIYDSTNSSFEFSNRVKALLTATIQPSEVGNISPLQYDSISHTGVRFTGSIKLDANGNVVGDQSKVTISVYDSVYITNLNTNPSEQEIRITFEPKAGRGATITGQFDPSSGSGTLILHDNYGEIRFEGQIDAQRMSGIVKFQNAANVMGGSNLSGSLGQFYIQRCAFFN